MTVMSLSTRHFEHLCSAINLQPPCCSVSGPHPPWNHINLSGMGAGLVYRSLGFPPQFFTVLFAIPRVTGYLSHWRESLSDPDTKILRPQQDYRVSICGKEDVSVFGCKLLVAHDLCCCSLSQTVFDEVLMLPKGSYNVFHAQT